MKQNSGQVVLITLLVLTVIMSIALSLIGRTRTDTTTSADVEDSARAFSAAEAGIEETLKGSAATGDTPVTLSGGTASYKTNVDTLTVGDAGYYAFPQITQSGDTETLWLVDHDDTGDSLNETQVYKNNSIGVCWKGTTTTPALVITLLYKQTSTGKYLLAKTAIDPNAGANANNFDSSAISSTGSYCGQTQVYKKTVTFPASINYGTDVLLALRLRPEYGPANISVDAGDQSVASHKLPKQGSTITSTGSTSTGISRKVEVTQQYRTIPSFFDMAIISKSDFSQ